MCQFILRPIKSYATVDINENIKRGDYVEVTKVDNGNVEGKLNGKDPVSVPLYIFVHVFTANPKDIEQAKQEETKLFKK